MTSSHKKPSNPHPIRTNNSTLSRSSRDASWEKPPSKDGSVQRAAGEVAGLKDYVGPFLSTHVRVDP